MHQQLTQSQPPITTHHHHSLPTIPKNKPTPTIIIKITIHQQSNPLLKEKEQWL